jgi:molecular chaperone GrpE (heat shock protein)
VPASHEDCRTINNRTKEKPKALKGFSSKEPFEKLQPSLDTVNHAHSQLYSKEKKSPEFFFQKK